LPEKVSHYRLNKAVSIYEVQEILVSIDFFVYNITFLLQSAKGCSVGPFNQAISQVTLNLDAKE